MEDSRPTGLGASGITVLRKGTPDPLTKLDSEQRPTAAHLADSLQKADDLLKLGEFREAYALICGIDAISDEGGNQEHFKAACLFWMGRLSEAEHVCETILEKSRDSYAEAILNQIPAFKRASAGTSSPDQQQILPTLTSVPTPDPLDEVPLRGTYQCYFCWEEFKVHNPASIVSPRPSLRPILCPYCFNENTVPSRTFGCPECHGRLNLNVHWKGRRLQCAWCITDFERPEDTKLIVLHDREKPWSFSGRSADPELSDDLKAKEIEPMEISTIGEVERTMLSGKLPPWVGCFRGRYDIERQFSEVASDYFKLRKHFDPVGAYANLFARLSWLTLPALSLFIFVVVLILLGRIDQPSPPIEQIVASLESEGAKESSSPSEQITALLKTDGKNEPSPPIEQNAAWRKSWDMVWLKLGHGARPSSAAEQVAASPGEQVDSLKLKRVSPSLPPTEQIAASLEIMAWSLLLLPFAQFLGRFAEKFVTAMFASTARILLDLGARLRSTGYAAGILSVPYNLVVLFPTAMVMGIMIGGGFAVRGILLFLSALVFLFAVWPVDVCLKLIGIQRRRRVTWDITSDDRSHFLNRTFFLEGLPGSEWARSFPLFNRFR